MKSFSLRFLLMCLALGWTTLPAATIEFLLPSKIFAVEGQAWKLYFDNVLLNEEAKKLQFDVECAVGEVHPKYWEVSANESAVGIHELTLIAKDESGRELKRANSTLHIASRNAGAGKELRLLMVGDSLTSATHYPNEIARLLSQLDNPKWTMLGTYRPSHAATGVQHEGYGGWTWNAFLKRWNPQKEGEAAGPIHRRTTSPFLYANEANEGVIDLPRYFKEQGGEPQIVTFLLGINDSFGAPWKDHEATEKHLEGVLESADQLLAAFHKAVPSAKLAIGLTTPPNARASAFDDNYKGKYTRNGWLKIQNRLVQKMIGRYQHRESENIYLVPTHLQLDISKGYPENNAVHPNVEGYAEIGKTFYAWIKYHLQN